MNLTSIVVHQIKKEANGVATPRLRANALPVNATAIDFVTRVKDAYYHKSNPNYGIFQADAGNYPFQTHLQNYKDGKGTFHQFSADAIKLLVAKMNETAGTTGGYVVFAEYDLQGQDFMMTIMLNNKKQYNIDDTNFDLAELFSLDIEKLDVANLVNLTRWSADEDTYLSFARGRKDISVYFMNFIGCTDNISAKQSSQNFKRAFVDYLGTLNLETEARNTLKNEVYTYCESQTKKKEDISLHHISSMINAESPELFEQYAASEDYRVGANIKGHAQILRTLKFYIYKSSSLRIEFDQSLVNNSTIRYDAKKNTLTIKNVPEELSSQFSVAGKTD